MHVCLLPQQAEHAEGQQNLKDAHIKIEELEATLASMSSDSGASAELSRLQFDKTALEHKLRKFASHCQHLEDEKSDILNVLRSSQRASVDDGDISKAIVSLCDRLASLEEECDSLSKADNLASSHLVEVEKLRAHNSSLQTQVSDSRKKVDRLLRSEIELKETIASLRHEQDELHRIADSARGTAENAESEKSRQVRYLEQENLQLMIDVKALKKQAKTLKNENNMLRTKALEDNTFDYGTGPVHAAGMPTDSRGIKPEQAKKPPAPNLVRRSKRERSSTSPDKENATNIEVDHQSNSRRRVGSSRKPIRKVPGLGEAFAENLENTQECKQS